MKAKSTRNSQATVRKFFPNVVEVVDAHEPLAIEVTKGDVKQAARMDHSGCAMAIACKRSYKFDGVIIGMSTAYVIDGTKATRYLVPTSIGREITSNDRGSGVAPGEYQLSAVHPSRQFGVKRWDNDKKSGKRDGSRSVHRHLTDGVRAVLGAK